MDSNLKAALLITALVFLAIFCVVCISLVSGYDGSTSIIAHDPSQSASIIF